MANQGSSTLQYPKLGMLPCAGMLTFSTLLREAGFTVGQG